MANSNRKTWQTIRTRIDAVGDSFPAYLKAAPDANLVRLIHDEPHRRNVFGFFDGPRADRAREIFNEIGRRAHVAFWTPAEGSAA